MVRSHSTGTGNRKRPTATAGLLNNGLPPPLFMAMPLQHTFRFTALRRTHRHLQVRRILCGGDCSRCCAVPPALISVAVAVVDGSGVGVVVAADALLFFAECVAHGRVKRLRHHQRPCEPQLPAPERKAGQTASCKFRIETLSPKSPSDSTCCPQYVEWLNHQQLQDLPPTHTSTPRSPHGKCHHTRPPLLLE